jgi:lysophospholipase L1-like esterase
MSSAVLNSWMQPSVLVYFGGAADARSDVSAEAYRQNLHRLWHRSRELGCRSMVIVHPITTAHQLPLGTVENVRHGTLLFADDRLEVCVISIDDLARSDRFLANDGIHLSPLGYAECGRRVGNTLERLRCG